MAQSLRRCSLARPITATVDVLPLGIAPSDNVRLGTEMTLARVFRATPLVASKPPNMESKLPPLSNSFPHPDVLWRPVSFRDLFGGYSIAGCIQYIAVETSRKRMLFRLSDRQQATCKSVPVQLGHGAFHSRLQAPDAKLREQPFYVQRHQPANTSPTRLNIWRQSSAVVVIAVSKVQSSLFMVSAAYPS